MTTIAFRAGTIAADSRVTVSTEAGGDRFFGCVKLFKKLAKIHGKEQEVILATAGESAPGALFVEWFGSGKDVESMRDTFVIGEADFTVLIVTHDGLFEVDKWCCMEPVVITDDKPYYAVGSGCKAALAAMAMGATAKRAVEIACGIDPHSAPPIITMTLNGKKKKPKPKVELPPAPRPDPEDPDAI
jgi:hypothetical protein